MTRKKLINPFELFSYQGPEYFCDREEEVERLSSSFKNRRFVVLSSMRRLGKTSLIHHWHRALSQEKNVIPIYLDVMDTASDNGFVNKFISAAINALELRSKMFDKVFEMFKSLRPKVSFDPVTGLPEISLDIHSNHEVSTSLEMIFTLMGNRKEQIQIAIDEFQQILNYESTNIDATIRGYFQKAGNVHFLFSGSEQHLLNTLFSDPAKPLFASTEYMNLSPIAYDPYFDFIKHHFLKSNISIKDEIIHEIMVWTKQHTFYTHFLCNVLYANSHKNVDTVELNRAKANCLQQFETSYFYFMKILSGNQKKMLVAIAKEQAVTNILGKEFLNKYKFSASSARQALQALVKLQMVYEKTRNNKSSYTVYDVFFSRWLENVV